jgi:hypothetical protein
MMNYQYNSLTGVEVNCEINDFIKMNMGLYNDALRFLGTPCETGEANPWLCGLAYDVFCEKPCNPATKIYAAVYKVEQTLRETVGDHIYLKFRQGFHVNNDKEVVRKTPTVPSAKRKELTPMPAKQQHPMWTMPPIPVPILPVPILPVPILPVPILPVPISTPMDTVHMSSAAGSSGQGGLATPQNFWDSRYPNPSPSVPTALPRKKLKPNVVPTTTVYNPWNSIAVQENEARAAINATANSHTGNLQNVPADSSVPSPVPPPFPQGDRCPGLLSLLSAAESMDRVSSAASPAQSHKKKPVASPSIPTRESLLRDRNGFILKMRLGEKVLAEYNAKIDTLCSKIKNDKEYYEKLRNVPSSAVGYSSALGYSSELQARKQTMDTNTTELVKMSLERSEQYTINNDLKKQFEGMDACFQAQMQNL